MNTCAFYSEKKKLLFYTNKNLFQYLHFISKFTGLSYLSKWKYMTCTFLFCLILSFFSQHKFGWTCMNVQIQIPIFNKYFPILNVKKRFQENIYGK